MQQGKYQEEPQVTSSIPIIIKNNPPAQVNADFHRICQALKNILINAIRFARESTQIIVDVDKGNDKVICRVTDFGSGIKPEQQCKIFEPYYRISCNNLHTYPGLG